MGASSISSFSIQKESCSVKNGKPHRQSPPANTTDDWLESTTLIGTLGWSNLNPFFMSNSQLYGVHQDNFYKGSPPTQGVSSDKWLASSTPIGKGGWNKFVFLMSPVKVCVNILLSILV